MCARNSEKRARVVWHESKRPSRALSHSGAWCSYKESSARLVWKQTHDSAPNPGTIKCARVVDKGGNFKGLFMETCARGRRGKYSPHAPPRIRGRERATQGFLYNKGMHETTTRCFPRKGRKAVEYIYPGLKCSGTSVLIGNIFVRQMEDHKS